MLGLLGLGALLPSSKPALANGAFPDAQSLSVAPGAGSTIVVATNFGLVRSDDDGATWTWTCELGLSSGGTLYSASFPSGRLFTRSSQGLAYSDDRACTWRAPTPATTAMSAVDYFLDPRDPTRVWLLGASAAATGPDTVFLSRDGGATFSPLTTAPSPGETFTGVESAARDSSWVVLASQPTPPAVPKVGVSRDGGLSFAWTTLETVGATLGVRLVAVDPDDPSKVYLRTTRDDGLGGNEEALAVVTGLDGAGGPIEVSSPVTVSRGKLTAFLRRSSGVVLVTGAGPTGPVAWRSSDGGASFAPWSTGGLHVRALAEKGSTLYVMGDALGAGDPFVLATGDDEGGPWHPLLSSFHGVGAVPACALAACQSSCANYVSLGVFSSSLCQTSVDGGANEGDGGASPPGDGGCQCAATSPAGSSGQHAPWLAALGLLALRRRRARSSVRD